ncbi:MULTISPECIES: cytidine deaminase [Persicobacter]|uniref:Cytidine deaminase n=1 Tax=Persicobacter diffluens TaxID=981 RepID=A0AAN5AIX4_9BACT|nr:cytidine deaminase [Persicobacter sp. CCB-QB2]GJM60327.1 cytidine deaminase [Persicobacter diffluens]
MQKEKQIIEYQVFNSIEELPTEEQKLVAAAQKATESAYAPYSKFHVGAALLMEDGQIFSGNNQENSAYPSGLCAERTVLFSTSANHPDLKIKTIMITAIKAGESAFQAVTPCGACRQVMSEYQDKQQQPYAVILENGNGTFIKINNVRDLLPFTFSGDQL